MTTCPDKSTILAMLRKWVAQRPGLEFGNYGDVSAYRSEMRSITKDRHVAEEMIRFCEWHDSITAENIMAGFSAYSGRLTLTGYRAWECACGHKWNATPKQSGSTANLSGEATQWCPKCGKRPLIGSPVQWRLDYCTGQYWPTEYRRAVCAVLSSVIWNYYRSEVPMGDEVKLAEFLKRAKADNPGDYLRRTCARQFGRTVGRRFFN